VHQPITIADEVYEKVPVRIDARIEARHFFDTLILVKVLENVFPPLTDASPITIWKISSKLIDAQANKTRNLVAYPLKQIALDKADREHNLAAA